MFCASNSIVLGKHEFTAMKYTAILPLTSIVATLPKVMIFKLYHSHQTSLEDFCWIRSGHRHKTCQLFQKLNLGTFGASTTKASMALTSRFLPHSPDLLMLTRCMLRLTQETEETNCLTFTYAEKAENLDAENISVSEFCWWDICLYFLLPLFFFFFQWREVEETCKVMSLVGYWITLWECILPMQVKMEY